MGFGEFAELQELGKGERTRKLTSSFFLLLWARSDAIWISPISANLLNSTGAGQAYHGYWPSNLFGSSVLSVHSLSSCFQVELTLSTSPLPLPRSSALHDTAANFQSLVTAVHSAGMALMVDIVVNDVAWNLPLATSVWDPSLGRSSPTATDGLYGALNQAADYHPRCVINYSNTTSVQNCE